MGRAAEAGTRYLSSVEKAMRRMSDKSSIESRNALSDAKREAETSLSLVEDALFAEAGIQECIGLCDSVRSSRKGERMSPRRDWLRSFP